MHINPIGPSFGKLIKINKDGIKISEKGEKDSREDSLVNTFYPSDKASESFALGTNIIGTAFVLQSVGLNSSGIVPAVIASSSPYLSPATVVLSNQHPSIAGTTLSTVANIVNSKNMIEEEEKPKIPD